MTLRSSPPSSHHPRSFQVASLLRPTPNHLAVTPAMPPVPMVNYTGVAFSDAAPGEVAMTVYIRGERVLRLEIAERYYSTKWFQWLERWARRQQPSTLSLVD